MKGKPKGSRERDFTHIPPGFRNAKLKISLLNGAAGNPDFST